MAADDGRMRLRGGITVGLVAVVLVAVVASITIATWRHRADQRNLAAAVALAHRVPAPNGAAPSRECRGDGLVWCWTSPSQARASAESIAASMRRLGGSDAAVRCDRISVGIGSAATTADECHVVARFGSHAVAVFTDPHWRRTPGGNTLDGSLISVAAA